MIIIALRGPQPGFAFLGRRLPGNQQKNQRRDPDPGGGFANLCPSNQRGALNAYVLKIDLTDPYLKVDTVLGADGTLNKNQPVLEMARRTGAVAAINGDFSQMKDSGRPIGLVYQDGQLIESPALRNDMFGFGLTKDNTVLLEVFEFSGEVTAENQKASPVRNQQTGLPVYVGCIIG